MAREKPMSETVWVFSKTPCNRNTPAASVVFDNEDAARKSARAWRARGWNVEVEEMQMLSEITSATRSELEREDV